MSKKKLNVPLYFVLKKGRQEPRLYETIQQLCDAEGLGESKFYKHFSKERWYRDDEYEIWKVQPYGH